MLSTPSKQLNCRANDRPEALLGERPSELFACFWRHDAEMSSDGVSRYGAYLAQRAHDLAAALDWAADSAGTNGGYELACACWRIARPPIMSPSFVRSSDRLIDESIWAAQAERDGTWGLRAAVRIAYRLPQRGWADWTTTRSDWAEPDPERGPVGLCSVRYEVRLPVAEDELTRGRLPDLASSGAVTIWAQNAVDRLVDTLNRTFAATTEVAVLAPC
jgi:hypothetical protein